MFHKKRLLNKDRKKENTKKILLFFLSVFVIFLILEYVFLNFSFGGNSYINPIAKNNSSLVLEVEKELEKAKIPFSSVLQNSDSSVTVSLKDGGEVILSSKKDIQTQISSLQLILSRLTIEEGKKLKNLDFRYNSPVISF